MDRSQEKSDMIMTVGKRVLISFILPLIVAAGIRVGLQKLAGDITSFEGWYMHSHMYKHPDLETYLYVEDGKWFIQEHGEIIAQGIYVEQTENELFGEGDPHDGTIYKYDFITEDGSEYRCWFEIRSGRRSLQRGRLSLDNKDVTVPQNTHAESAMNSTYVRISKPKEE